MTARWSVLVVLFAHWTLLFSPTADRGPLSWLLSGVAHGAEVEVRLIAADQKEKTSVDQMVDFRRAADGGLIAVTWLSGMKSGETELFPVKSRGDLAPTAPDLASSAPRTSKKLQDDADDLLGDIKKEAAKNQKIVIRPVDKIDPLYVDQNFSIGRPVGPQRSRASMAILNANQLGPLSPGVTEVSPKSTRVEVPCYPVTITATQQGQPGTAATFVPQLTYGERDLLADCLFEHSPDLPLGDVSSTVAANLETLEGWLNASRGGQRPFRKLTIYLPENKQLSSTAYELNGHKFHVSAEGVKLLAGTDQRVRTQLQSNGKFGLELLLPAVTEKKLFQIPLLSDLGAGWQGPEETVLTVPSGASVLTLTVHSPDGRPHVLRPSLPISAADAARWHLYALLVGGRTLAEGPAVYMVGVSRSKENATQTILVRGANETGSLNLPKQIALTLTRPYPWGNRPEANPSSEEALGKVPLPIEFSSIKSGEYAGSFDRVQPGGYLATCRVGETALPAFPLAVTDESTRGAVTLATYHNRCDYYRGEEVQVAIIVRAVEEVQIADAPILLESPLSEKPMQVGSLTLNVPAGESRTRFITLPTASLPLGEHTLSLSTAGAISYPVRFTLYSPTPKTTFALYSWMTGSFSGPVRVGDQTIANLLLDQRPTQFLSPHETQQYTDQQTVPVGLKQTLASDPYLPASEKTATYDPETELEMAVAMRLGLRYAPSYGWGLNSQEANWNPKHTLPEDLAKIRRLCSLVAQRFRAFGNYAGMHLNWYPTFGGYWENHPATDGHAKLRNQTLGQQVSKVQLPEKSQEIKLGPEAELDLAAVRHKYRVGALPRAYEAWTAGASQLLPGMTNRPLSNNVNQPGLSPQSPLYSSFLPISWFDQQSYYPSTYFSTLPAATVHAYTDYGFSPFQPVWGLDFWAAGTGNKPKWITTMSNGRDIMFQQAMLTAGRGADGIDINGSDEKAARVISELMTRHGPLFRRLEPESDVAIITSLRQQILHGKLVGRWMGYTGGTYFDLYTKLWYARHPADVLLEEEVTPERLQKYSAVFLVNQQAALAGDGNQVLADYAKAGGKVFKDKATAASFPGDVYQLEGGEPIGPQWQGDKYVATRDQMFVGVHSSYEASANELDKLLAQLPAPRVKSDSHHTLLATLAGKKMAVVMAVNDTRSPPGIYHPWNFWSATVLAAEGKLSFDKPYVVYDLLAGGELLHPQPDGQGRFTLSISFDRVAAKPLVLLPAELREIKLTALPLPSVDKSKQDLALQVSVVDAHGQAMTDPCPVEISVTAELGQIEETFYRAVTSAEQINVTLPYSEQGEYRVQVKELISGLTVEELMKLSPTALPPAKIEQALVTRPAEVQTFFSKLAAEEPTGSKAETAASLMILFDQTQAKANEGALLTLAEEFAKKLNSDGYNTQVEVIDPLDLVEIPQRWQATERDKQYLAEMRNGKRPVTVALPLYTKYYQGERNRNQPDYLHPESGYGEQAAKYRMASHVILLGSPDENRYLNDLHQQVGLLPESDWLAPESAVVQVVWDAFSPKLNALTISASDQAGVLAGMRAVLKELALSPKGAKATSEGSPPRIELDENNQITSNKRTELTRWENEFGATVSPISFTPDGGVLASADLQAENYFRFDADGKLQQSWLGKYAVTPAVSGETLWTSAWWGAPDYVDKVVRCDANAQPQWLMDAPRYSRSFQHWRHPGNMKLPDNQTDDLFVAGFCRLARLSPEGKTLWAYDDTPSANDIEAFRFRRDLMLHDISPDGRLLLVAAFGIEPYANLVNKFVRPALLLFDAKTGKLLWEKKDILVDHTACHFTKVQDSQGVNILVGDETPDQQRLLLLDEKGALAWSIPRPDGTSKAALAADGTYVIAQTAIPRSRIFEKLGEPQGLQVMQVKERKEQEIYSGVVSAWKFLPTSNQVLISQADGGLSLYKLNPSETQLAINAKLLWSQSYAGPTNFIVSEDEQQIVIGTPDGKLRWLDEQGKTAQAVDLLPYNRVKDLDQYVKAYTRTPGDVPRIEPVAEAPLRIDDRTNGVVSFSKNLLPEHAILSNTKPFALTAGDPIKLTAKVKSGATHVLSLTQHLPNPDTAADMLLQATVQTAGEKQPLYMAELPLSANWEERTLAWRVPKQVDEVTITLQLQSTNKEQPELKSNENIELRSAGLFTIAYPSDNLLAQRVPSAPGELPSPSTESADLGFSGGGKSSSKPPTLRYFIPNDVDLTARSRGAPPFQRTVEFTTPFDGILAGQKTSWLAKPLGGSTHATLEVKLDQPALLGSLAVYEDATSAAHYTDTYALFIKEAKTGRLRQVGSVTGNRSPFNLFTFPKTEVESITYLWLKSADRHARLAELEGYLAEQDLLE